MSAELISALSLMVAGIGLGWNIYRDCINKPKVKDNIYIAEYFLPGRGPQPQIVSVNVTNVGKQALIIKGNGFTAKDKKQFLFPEMMSLFNNKKLETSQKGYERICNFTESEKGNRLRSKHLKL